jgi:hypothetical protein
MRKHLIGAFGLKLGGEIVMTNDCQNRALELALMQEILNESVKKSLLEIAHEAVAVAGCGPCHGKTCPSSSSLWMAI